MTGLDVSAPPVPRSEEVLTPEALAFVADLDARFHERRDELLAARRSRREEIARTGHLDFLPGTADVRDSDWTVAPVPADLRDRRVEITGPTDPKMAINALNSGARVWLADLEDANTPHWRNVVGGQLTLRDAVRGRLAFTSPEGKEYAVADPASTPVVLPRPRGWHFDEAHLLRDGRPVVAALVDFGLHFFHNARELLAAGSGPYYYLPKMESHLEARLWDDVFTHAEAALGVPHGSVRATVLIETITAAFEMDEILHELRNHAAGLNAGRWDYLLDVLRDDVAVSAADLLAVGETPGERTEAGLRGNVRIGMQYLHAWLSGNGAAAIDNLMEDAATAEISRSQVWQWVRAGRFTADEVRREVDALRDEHQEACELFEQVALSEELVEFLTL